MATAASTTVDLPFAPFLSPADDSVPVTRIQKYSSYAFGVFLTFHITNTSLAPLLTRSVAASETYLLLTRPYYQSALAEPLVVLLPLLAHVLSGSALRLVRRRNLALRYGADSATQRRSLSRSKDKTSFWPRLSATSALGYGLVPLLAGHVLVNRVVPLNLEGGSSSVGLTYVSHGFARHPVLAASAYALLVTVASWHFVGGLARWLRRSPNSTVPPAASTEGLVPGVAHAQDITRAGDARPGPTPAYMRFWNRHGVNACAALVATVWMAGGLGVVGRAGLTKGWLGALYDDLYSRVPVVGRWL